MSGLNFSDAITTGLNINSFIEQSPIAILHLDTQGRILEANHAFSALMQGRLSPQPSRHLVDCLPAEDQPIFKEAFARALAGEAVAPISLNLTLSPGGLTVRAFTYITVMQPPGHPPVAMLHLIDQTEQKNLEHRFAHSQKMQAVGQLAGGVAHDFNNLLTAMIGFCDLLLMRHQAGDPSFADIMQIKQNANRAANLVRQLLAFSRRQTLQPKTLDLTDVMAELSNLIRRLIGENIQMAMIHGRELWAVRADQGQLEQVIINLAVNARDAMKDGGTLTIRSSNVTVNNLDDIPRDLIAPTADEVLAPGDYVLVEVSDTGTGIPPDLVRTVFEPFFSTKEIGSGTGLGLSTCYGIIKQTGGYIYVRTALGQGTSIFLYLKRAEQESASAPAAESGEERHHADLTGRATILIVEDEAPVRIFAARALRNKGYEVLEADEGETALALYASHPAPIDLVLSDVMMPGMNGPTMIQQMQERFPERMATTKTVFISGYAEDAFVDTYGSNRHFHFLPKPFTLKQLAAKIKDVLEGASRE